MDTPFATFLELEVLDSVGEVHFRAIDTGVFQRPIQKDARRAHERTTGEILSVARHFTHHYDSRRGPAFAEALAETEADAKDWPTYRHDPARSGYTNQKLTEDLSQAWELKLGGKLSAPVVAALTSGTDAGARLEALLADGPPKSEDDVSLATSLITDAGGLTWAAQEADDRLRKALSHLETLRPSSARDDLATLARYVVERDR